MPPMRSILRRIFFFILTAAAVMAAFSCLQVLSLRWINPPFTAYMVWEKLEHWDRVHLGLDWRAAPDLSPNMALAVLAAEDQRFYEHQGFDWAEIRSALDRNKTGKKLRGASTITMQVARNLFLWSGRSWLRKGLEAYYTVLLELFVPKNRILEIYLNVAEFGLGLYGAPAASMKYFGRPADALNRDQAARLAVVLPSPKYRSPLKMTSYLAARRNFVLSQMRNLELQNWPK